MKENDFRFKVLMLGEKQVGKTTLTYRYMTGLFVKDLKGTIGVDLINKEIEFNSHKVSLQIWDFAGEKRFRRLLPSYCLGANGAFLLYDITNLSTFECLLDWISIVRSKTNNIPFILIGTKSDLENHREVSSKMGQKAKKDNALTHFLELSSKTGKHVQEAFELMVKRLFENMKLTKV